MCGLLRPKVDSIDVSDGYMGAINFSILQSKDPHIIDVSPFQYDCDVINNTCGNKKQSLWFCGLQVLEKHSYVRDATYIT